MRESPASCVRVDSTAWCSGMQCKASYIAHTINGERISVISSNIQSHDFDITCDKYIELEMPLIHILYQIYFSAYALLTPVNRSVGWG